MGRAALIAAVAVALLAAAIAAFAPAVAPGHPVVYFGEDAAVGLAAAFTYYAVDRGGGR